MKNRDLEYDAYRFAVDAHAEQKRKYTGAPYVTHCMAVAFSVTARGGSSEQIAAAFLHDTVEDTSTTLEEIADRFGPVVAGLVFELTDVYTKEAYPDMNRAERKRREAQRLANVSEEAKLIKLCDLIDNTKSIVEHDPGGFAPVYLREKAYVLECMFRRKK